MYLNHPDRLIRRNLRGRYLITMLSRECFEGVLTDADERHFVLADAAQINPRGDRVSIDGQLWLPRAGVAYLQAQYGPAQ